MRNVTALRKIYGTVNIESPRLFLETLIYRSTLIAVDCEVNFFVRFKEIFACILTSLVEICFKIEHKDALFQLGCSFMLRRFPGDIITLNAGELIL